METVKKLDELKKFLKEAITPGTIFFNQRYYSNNISGLVDKIISCEIYPADGYERLDELLDSFFQSYQNNKDFDKSFGVFCTGLKEPTIKEDDDKHWRDFLEHYFAGSNEVNVENYNNVEGYNAIKKLAEGLRLCKNCAQPIPWPNVDLSKYDHEQCEKTGINDRCYLFKKRCRDVKIGDETCRNVEPEPTWFDELKKRKATHKFMVDGKVNLKKLKRELKEHGAQWTEHKNPDEYRGGVANARYFFIQRYMIFMEPIADRIFCSEQCKNTYHNKNK
jgi:hypothetical protein